MHVPTDDFNGPEDEYRGLEGRARAAVRDRLDEIAYDLDVKYGSRRAAERLGISQQLLIRRRNRHKKSLSRNSPDPLLPEPAGIPPWAEPTTLEGETMNPKITISHVRALLDAAPDADRVLHIDAGGDLAVDHESYAHHSRVVYTQEGMRNLFRSGTDPVTDDAIRDLLPDLQADVDQVVETLNA